MPFTTGAGANDVLNNYNSQTTSAHILYEKTLYRIILLGLFTVRSG